MRRSAAPSQSIQASKRPCFKVPYLRPGCVRDEPFAAKNSDKEKHFSLHNIATKCCDDQATTKAISETGANFQKPIRSTKEILKLFSSVNSKTGNEEGCKENRNDSEMDIVNLESPVTSFNDQRVTSNLISYSDKEPFPLNDIKCNQSDDNGNNNSLEVNLCNSTDRYYSVMFCKYSKKKHKKWEGDAVLIIKGRTAILQDLEAKQIAQGIGYQSKKLNSLQEGETLMIGGKECEIQYEIKKEDFKSGKCFLNATSVSMHSVQPSVPFKKPFVKPAINAKDKFSHSQSNSAIVLPRYKMTSSSFVMPQPNSFHQWNYNKEHLPIVDVIVDPTLSVHLRPHQREGILFLYEVLMEMRKGVSGAILADEMGLGKTLQCICIIWTLIKQGPYGGKPVIKKVLIITPSSLVKNWQKEFNKWLGKEKLAVFAVDVHNKVQDFINSYKSVLLISYEMFVRNFEALSNFPFDLLICDEGHRLKNTNIKTSSLIAKISTSRRILLTGTPIQNDLQELHSIVEFCNPGILGSSSSFRRIYEEPITRSRQPNSSSEEREIGEERAAELTHLMSSFILRRTQDVINKYLPPKVEYVVFCKPTDLQVRLYEHLLNSREVRTCLSSWSSLDGSYHLICIAALRKLCNMPCLLFNKILDEGEENEGKMESIYKHLHTAFPSNFSNIPVTETSGKLQVLSNLLSAMHASSSEKIVVVSSFTETLNVIEELCKEKNFSFLRLDGSTPSASRQNIVDSFNSSYSKHFVFLLSSKAGGVGLNLIGASRILLYDVDWNPANDLQAMSRVWRDGQKHKVHVYRLLTTGTIEEKMYQRQISKQSLSGKVMDLMDSLKSQFSLEDLKDLFTLCKDSQCTTHDLMQCHCTETDNSTTQNQMKITQTESFQRTCQLGTLKPVSLVKNTTMAELYKWDHIPGPVSPLTFQDNFLAAGGDHITFVLQNEVNSQLDDVCT